MDLTNHLLELLISGVLGLVVWIFRTVTTEQKNAFIEYKKEQEKKWEAAEAALIRKEAAEERRRKEQEDFFVRLLGKNSEEMGKLVTEIWEEVRDFKTDRKRYDEEVWKQINALKDRQNAMELLQAKAYHTKPEFDQILQEKLDPIKTSLIDIQRQLGNKRTQ